MSNAWTGGQYSIFRALLGMYLFVHFAHLVPWAAEMFSSSGTLGNAELSPLARAFPNVLAVFDRPAMVYASLCAGAGASVLLALGRFDRIAALAAWYVLACLFGRNPLIQNPALPYVGWMLIFPTCLPHAPYGSLEARRREDLAPNWRMPPALFAATWIVLAVSYSYSGYTKLLSPSWVAGDTVRYVLENPLARDTLLSHFFLSLPDGVLHGITWFILSVELLFAPLALVRKLRPWLWAAMLFVQFGFLFLLNFADLTAGMLLFHLLTFDPAWIAPVRATRGETIYYDGACGSCHRVVRFVLTEDRAQHFRFAPLQSVGFAPLVLSPEAARVLPDSFVVADQRDRLLLKSDAAIHVLCRIGGIWRLFGALLMCVPKRLRDAGYDLVGANRHRMFERPSTFCPIVPAQLRGRFTS